MIYLLIILITVKFKLNKNSSLIDIVEIISKPSNVFYKFTVIDGWQFYQLENYMKSNFGASMTSKNDINKVLLHLEIMNLISVRWMGKNSKRIELSENNDQKSNALW